MEPEDEQRRLTTILAADVVGCSRLMGEDEAGTLAALKARRKELIDPKSAQDKRRVVKLMGDGVNIAARLEGLADPGSVRVSRTVFAHVKNKHDVTLEHLGEQRMKTIAEPVEVYRVPFDPAGEADRGC